MIHNNQGTPSSKHLLYVDVIRAWAIHGVILLHAASPLVRNIGGLEPDIWWWANIYDSFVRNSVPLFLMVSGLLLLNPHKDESASVFFRKRTMKVIIPYLFWGVFYLLLKAIIRDSSFRFSNLIELISGPIYNHFWFIYTIVGLYLVTPIFRVYTKQASTSHYIYFGSLWFICAGVIPFIERFTGISIAFDFVVVVGLTGYFMMGFALRNVTLTSIQRWIIVGVFIIAWGTTMLGSALVSGDEFDGTFYDYLSPNVMLLSLSSFLLIKSLPWERWVNQIPGMHKVLSLVSGTSLGVYFIHYILLEIFHYGNLGFVLDGTTFHPSVAIPLVGIIIHTISCLSVWMLSKMPIGRFIVP